MTRNGKPNIAFIGLGQMGTPISARLMQNGYSVQAFDLQEKARRKYEEMGGKTTDSLAKAVAGAEFIILMLPDSQAVEEVMNNEDIRSVIQSDSIVLDMSSSDPRSTLKLAEEFASLRVEWIDAPVSGGVKGAKAGTLTIMLGADSEPAQETLVLLQKLGSVKHVGPIGSGHAMKALNNYLSATHLAATAEAIAIANIFGVRPETAVEAFNESSGRSGSTDNKFPNHILPHSFDSGFTAALMAKDVGIAKSLADESSLKLTLVERTESIWSRAVDELPIDADHTEIARLICSPARQG